MPRPERLSAPAASRFLQQLSCDDDSLNLIGAVPYLVNLCVTVEALDRIFLRICVTTEDLHCVGDMADTHVAGEEFRVRRFLGKRVTLITKPGGLVHQQTCGLDLCRHVGQHELHRLEVRYRLSELPTFLR